MTAPITPDERAALRESALVLRDLTDPTTVELTYIEYVPRLLDALDTAEAEVGLQRERLRSRERAAGRLRAEVTRLHAEVARLRAETLRATASPAWDEDTVTEAVARAMFPHFFTDDRQPLRVFGETRSDAELWEAERESARRKARQALAVVREHAPVRPDRETILGTIKHHVSPPVGRNRLREAEGKPFDADDLARGFERATDAVLALWPGESRATVQAEALRDAAAALLNGTWPDGFFAGVAGAARELTARADRLEKGADRG